MFAHVQCPTTPLHTERRKIWRETTTRVTAPTTVTHVHQRCRPFDEGLQLSSVQRPWRGEGGKRDARCAQQSMLIALLSKPTRTGGRLASTAASRFAVRELQNPRNSLLPEEASILFRFCGSRCNSEIGADSVEQVQHRGGLLRRHRKKTCVTGHLSRRVCLYALLTIRGFEHEFGNDPCGGAESFPAL